MKPEKVTASSIRAGMAKRWAAPEWAIMWEVANATGTGASRYADAVMMSLWPSRGLELHGVEIKVSRSDWKREAADPTKAEAVARYCDRWWVHTAPGVVDDLSSVPPAWGLREYDGRVWRTLREAEKTEAQPVTRQFLASLLRRADDTMKTMMREAMREARDAGYEEIQKARKQIAEQVEEGVKRRTERFSRMQKRLADFEAAFGSGEWEDYAALGRAARALREATTGWGSVPDLANRLRRAADEIDAIQSMVTDDAPPG